jgi:hypothetical protein
VAWCTNIVCACALVCAAVVTDCEVQISLFGARVSHSMSLRRVVLVTLRQAVCRILVFPASTACVIRAFNLFLLNFVSRTCRHAENALCRGSLQHQLICIRLRCDSEVALSDGCGSELDCSTWHACRNHAACGAQLAPWQQSLFLCLACFASCTLCTSGVPLPCQPL